MRVRRADGTVGLSRSDKAMGSRRPRRARTVLRALEADMRVELHEVLSGGEKEIHRVWGLWVLRLCL